MKLISIEIQNYRSIDKLEITVEEINNSNTFALIGINESGKSSILKGINLLVAGELSFPLDFSCSTNEVTIRLKYSLGKKDIDSYLKWLSSKLKVPNEIISKLIFDEVVVETAYQADEEMEAIYSDYLNFKQTTFPEFTLEDDIPAKKESLDLVSTDFDIVEYLSTQETYFWDLAHDVLFWEASSKYLITEDIPLEAFALKPIDTSIPLSNCFRMAKFDLKKLDKIIDNLKIPANILNLENQLSDAVTKHINKVWPEHEVAIKFKINDKKISLLIEDDGVPYNAKTTGQRSDGFRQFISFLLTISAESSENELTNHILLLDEPETHLHPQAQLNLLKELIKITSNSNNNLVFFATHSNFMMDKEYINRCFKVQKHRNQHTTIEKLPEYIHSYAEVNYEVFGIPTSDYHTELYGFVLDNNKEKLDGLKKDKKWKRKDIAIVKEVSLSEYIRHSIHHPENTLNTKFTEGELVKSIKLLRGIKYNG